MNQIEYQIYIISMSPIFYKKRLGYFFMAKEGKEMFQNKGQRYVTKEVMDTLPVELQAYVGSNRSKQSKATSF